MALHTQQGHFFLDVTVAPFDFADDVDEDGFKDLFTFVDFVDSFSFLISDLRLASASIADFTGVSVKILDDLFFLPLPAFDLREPALGMV